MTTGASAVTVTARWQRRTTLVVAAMPGAASVFIRVWRAAVAANGPSAMRPNSAGASTATTQHLRSYGCTERATSWRTAAARTDSRTTVMCLTMSKGKGRATPSARRGHQDEPRPHRAGRATAKRSAKRGESAWQARPRPRTRNRSGRSRRDRRARRCARSRRRPAGEGLSSQAWCRSPAAGTPAATQAARAGQAALHRASRCTSSAARGPQRWRPRPPRGRRGSHRR